MITLVLVAVAVVVVVVVIVTVVARVVLAMIQLLLGDCLVFLVVPQSYHLFELRDRTRALATELFICPAEVQPLLEVVDDLSVGDVNDGCTHIEEATHVLSESFTLCLFDHGQVHAST